MENDMFTGCYQHEVEWSTIANMFFLRKLAPMDVKIEPYEDGGEDSFEDDLDDECDDEDDTEDDETDEDEDEE